MLRLFVSIVVLAPLAAGCGADEPATTTPAPAHEAHELEEGHSDAVRKYYGDAHDHGAEGDVEAEYHQPPRPASGGVGDTITLTGSNIGVRAEATVTGVDDPATASRPPRDGMRYVAVRLRLRSTGIAVLEGELRSGRLSYEGGAAGVRLGVEADCSNGFHESVRIGDEDPATGCLLFELPEHARPEELRFALETVPAEVGGRWRLR